MNEEMQAKKKKLNYIWIYNNIKQKENYQKIEKNFYSKYNVSSLEDKIYHELIRIRKYAIDKNIANIEDMIKIIIDNIELLKLLQTDYSKYEKQKQIIKYIIELEIKLGITITLYQEYIDYYEEIKFDLIDQKKKELV